MVPEATFLSPQFAAVLLGAHVTLLAAFAHFRWAGPSGGLLQAFWRFLTYRNVTMRPDDRTTGASVGVQEELDSVAHGTSSAALHHTTAGPRTRSATAKFAEQTAKQISRNSLEGLREPAAKQSSGGRVAGTAPGTVSSNISGESLMLSHGHLVEMVMCSNLIGIVCARSLHYQFYCWYFHSLPFLLWRTELPVVARGAILVAIEWCWNVYPSSTVSSSLLLAAHVLLLAALWGSRCSCKPRIFSKAEQE